MFCDKCGTQLPDGARFCGTCGNVIGQQAPAQQPVEQPVYQQPVYQQPAEQPAYQPPVYQQAGQPMTRGQFIKNTAAVKGLSWGSCIILLLCAVLIGVCLYITLWGSITELPALNLVAAASGGDMDQLDDVFDDGLDDLDSSRRQLEELVPDTDDEEEAVELAMELVDEAEEMFSKRSIMGMRKMITSTLEVNEKIEDLDIDGYEVEEISELTEVMTVLDVLIAVFCVCFGVGILLAVLAGIFRNNVLTVFALLSSVGMCALCASPLLAVVLLALYIVAIVLNSKLTGQYKAYRRSLGLYN